MFWCINEYDICWCCNYNGSSCVQILFLVIFPIFCEFQRNNTLKFNISYPLGTKLVKPSIYMPPLWRLSNGRNKHPISFIVLEIYSSTTINYLYWYSQYCCDNRNIPNFQSHFLGYFFCFMYFYDENILKFNIFCFVG